MTQNTSSDTGSGLAGLEARLAEDLDRLALPAKPWLLAHSHEGQPVLDVAVIGAGQFGLAACAALRHLGIEAIAFDAAPEGLEGPWATTARMETLRSPKELTGPALGFASLTFRAWFEAQFGRQAWATLDKIPRLQWMDYLRWYRKVLALDVRNLHEVIKVEPLPGGLVRLRMNTPSGEIVHFARRVVLATGYDGLGGRRLPAFVDGLPTDRWCHSSDVFDFNRLRGLRVGVVGAGASSMDSAASALEAGAASADLLIRRHDIPRINKVKGASNAGFMIGHWDLPDEDKWRIRHYINVQQVPPPRASMLRVSRHANARFHLGCPVLDVQSVADGLRVVTPEQSFTFDFMVFSTGFHIDWSERDAFAPFAAHVRSWGDRFLPEPGQEDAELGASPDLGRAFELQERVAGACPGLDHIHCFNFPASLTHGYISGDIPGISVAARRLSEGIASLLYREDFAQHFKAIEAFAEPEVFGDEWTDQRKQKESFPS
ncbi:SidA/IucD/PvdA family monooxygenase [Hydrogenophaga palleronii]|uniref:SidA/IucD/PvdA family monooxygenase n=1 Tax=Hydrogenophaga palleronii TaxID=65655 RepID=UPI0008265F34|nr:NAD(P)/FAD-dependent oxidoreductase [Hydrogenophaga palleronii]